VGGGGEGVASTLRAGDGDRGNGWGEVCRRGPVREGVVDVGRGGGGGLGCGEWVSGGGGRAGGVRMA